METTHITKHIKIDVDTLSKAHSRCWSLVPPLWPFKSMVAVNPLMGFTSKPFGIALQQGHDLFSRTSASNDVKRLNLQTIKWCQAFFDEGQASLKIPNKDLGLYKCLKRLFLVDSTLHLNNKDKVKWIKTLPDCPKLCIIDILETVYQVEDKDLDRFLTEAVVGLPGWAGHVRYRSWKATPDSNDDELTWSFTAIKLILAILLDIPLGTFLSQKKNQLNLFESHFHQIQLNEKKYQNTILRALEKAEETIEQPPSNAQFIFCIDTRSEPMRRALELNPHTETYGMAGFFGVPVKLTMPSKNEQDHCPIILNPSLTAEKRIKDQNYARQKKREAFLKTLYHNVKYNFSTPFSAAESLGFLSGLTILLKNVFPSFSQKIRDSIFGAKKSLQDYKYVLQDISLEEKISLGQAVLKTIGIQRFAPKIVFIGHGSTTENNAYATSLHCGACGGNTGGDNAHIIAEIMNDTEVKKGLSIPSTTTFYSGEYDTTSQKIELHQHSNSLLPLIQDAERSLISQKMDHQKTSLSPKTKSVSWSEIRPEWGLSKNALFIIGNRSISKKIDLEGRAFLHSYDASQDMDGAFLEAIMTGPLLVGHWINAQYFFSTLNQKTYGGGSKVTNNVTGKIGIIQGNASDLMPGLSLQSLYKTDKAPHHALLRLTVFIEAPLEKIVDIIKTHESLRELVTNEWIFLYARAMKEDPIKKLNPNLLWKIEA